MNLSDEDKKLLGELCGQSGVSSEKVLKLMWSGHDHIEAFHQIAIKLDVRYNTVSSQCTRSLGLTTDEFLNRVASKKIVDLIESKFPEQYHMIKTHLKK